MKLLNKVVVLSVVCLLFSCIVNDSFALTLTQQGKSDYTIVIGDRATITEWHGATELQKFIQEISKTFIPIKRDNEPVSGPMILVGRSSQLTKIDNTIDFQSLGTEGYVIKTKEPHLIIAGGQLRGTMYGVYTFLEDILGCRWYTDQISKIPRMETITFGQLNIKEVPAFEYREPFWREGFDRDWAARNKTNGSSTELDDMRGGKVRMAGVHSYYPLVPPQKYFGDHPEYYSIIGGKRYWQNAQVCETNMEMMKLMTQHLIDWLERNPSDALYTVGANDWAGICDCKDCQEIGRREESMAGPGIYLVNGVAERIEKHLPDRFIGFLTYKHTVKPPKTLVPRRNVVIRMCPISDCKMHPIVVGRENPEGDCALRKALAEDLEKWDKISNKIYIWDYYTNFRQYLLPFPCIGIIDQDLRFYRDHNVKGLFMQGCGSTRGAYLSILKSYIMAKLLWNPDRDMQAIIDDFITGVYGKAAGPVREYVDLFENTVKNKKIHATIREEATVEYLSEDILKKAETLLADARRIAENDPELSFRIELLSLPVEFVRFSQPIPHSVQGDVFAIDPSAAGWANTRAVDLFMQKVNKHNMEELRESRGVEEQYQRMIANVSNHQIVTLESPHLKVEFIPSLGGRIYRLIHKKSGKNVLRLPQITDFRYPETMGFEERLQRSSTINKGAGYAEPYEYVIRETPKGKQIILTSRINSRGMHHDVLMKREITLLNDEPALSIHSEIQTLPIEQRFRESRSEPLCINTGSFLELGTPVDNQIGFKKPDGSFEWYAGKDITELPREEERIADHGKFRLFRGKTIQSGTWCIINQQNRLGIINTFNPDQVDICYVKIDDGANWLEMRLWGNEKELKQGEPLSIDQKIQVTDDIESLIK